jgi:hypothetical protein
MTTFIGMAVVDLQRWDRNMQANMQYNTRRTVAQILKVGVDTDDVKDCFNIFMMVALLAKPLHSSEFRFWETEEQQAKWQMSQREDPLTRTQQGLQAREPNEIGKCTRH